ncbi:unnamed protein product [Schistocephalus solidus]|nr:unnamed protein product [Schistocephalus solidus]
MPTTSLAATAWGGKSTVGTRGHESSAGTASSVTFTPLQGLEIVNPMASERQVDEHKKYFSATAGFVNVKGKTPAAADANESAQNHTSNMD